MLNFYQHLANTLKQSPVVLATVTSTKGSVPKVGAKMFVCPDNRTVGTIGGGALEAKVFKVALEVLETGEKQFVEIDLSGVPQRETQGVCGGKMLIWLELWSGNEALCLVNQIIDSRKYRKSGAIVTPFDADKKPYLETTEETTEILNSPLLQNHAFIEPLLSPPTLLIIGGGHIALTLAQIAKIAGFQVIVQDDRPDFATKERFPEAFLLPHPITSIQEILDKIPNLYVALVTRGYQQDLAALRIILNYQLQYLGMVGSKTRVATVYKMLQNQGYSSQLETIYAPIGLDIGALTPEEIAVGICAELIKVRRGGTGKSLCLEMLLK